ncbi:MAG: sugar-binding protein [Spirochaetaceae bacterium]|jgi:putative multiple sugar transport system substrate-binding protein|nr:sugar-binding protein [Spirochaetaceae bacterium]
MKKFLLVLLVLSVALGSVFANGQQGGGSAGGKGLIGIVMPTSAEERWNIDGNSVKEGFDKLGYQTDLQFSNNDIPTQVSQIEAMLLKGAKAIVIGSIDGSALGDVLQKCADAKCITIAYDRLLTNSPNVDYYVTFDNYKVGQHMGKIVVDGLKLDQAPAGKTYNIELFGGSPDDNNAVVVYNGAMEILKPYFDKGVITVPSGQTDFQTIATMRWDAAEAQKRMENLFSAFYTDKNLDGVLSPYDPISLAILESAKGLGYAKGSATKPLPVAGGQDCIVASCKSINDGEQYATILKDTRQLGAATVKLVDEVLSGKTPAGLDMAQYKSTDTHVVPSLLLEDTIVTKANLKSAVVDTGYHTAAECGF